ncbi:MAG: aldehyde ferredoxin oxidoreductase N-terminal domain-containing protein, partial [Chloroflexota bacterium]|nr:aldehyde ferredoxin oxidoreductase N-terminal domain-containing protein [Chloroflexota bacterium]
MSTVPGYAGKLLRVNLSEGRTTPEELDGKTLRTWLGGANLGAKLLYDSVPAGVAWSDPGNCLILAAGPLNGAHLAGSGTFTVVTKGPLTNGAAISQANGYFGAYLKFSGFDAVTIQGQAKKWTYLYLHDGVAELRDATHLVGKDAMETEKAIKKELGKPAHAVSVFSIGPAGE